MKIDKTLLVSLISDAFILMKMMAKEVGVDAVKKAISDGKGYKDEAIERRAWQEAKRLNIVSDEQEQEYYERKKRLKEHVNGFGRSYMQNLSMFFEDLARYGDLALKSKKDNVKVVSGGGDRLPAAVEFAVELAKAEDYDQFEKILRANQIFNLAPHGGLQRLIIVWVKVKETVGDFELAKKGKGLIEKISSLGGRVAEKVWGSLNGLVKKFIDKSLIDLKSDLRSDLKSRIAREAEFILSEITSGLSSPYSNGRWKYWLLGISISFLLIIFLSIMALKDLKAIIGG